LKDEEHDGISKVERPAGLATQVGGDMTKTRRLIGVLATILLAGLGTAAFGQGTVLWAHGFGNPRDDSGNSVAVDSSGDVLVTGNFEGSVDFGGGALTSAGLTNTFLAKYSPTGAHLWSKSFGSFYSEGRSVAVDISGNVVVTGLFTGSVDFGGGPLTAAVPGFPDIFVAKFSPSGGHLWSQRFRGLLFQSARAMALDNSGNVLLVGFIQGTDTVDFGGGPLVGVGEQDIFVAKFSPSGAHLWSQRFGGTGPAGQISSVATDSSGNVLLAGTFMNTVDFGGGALTSAGEADIFVAKYTPAGLHLWSQRFGSTGWDSALSVAADRSGNVLVTGDFVGTVAFGGASLTSAGDFDIFVAKFSPAGGHLWSRRLGGPGTDIGLGVAVDNIGNVLLTGSFEHTVNFGGGELTSAGLYDIFVATLSPAGEHVWSRAFGGTDLDWGTSLASDGSGNVMVTGVFKVAVNFGGIQLTSNGSYDIFLLKLSGLGPVSVEIDIKPGSYPNSINLASHGTVPVAILSSATFDATTLNPETVRLAGASVMRVGKPGRFLCASQDVNGDGRMDLVCHVFTEQLLLNLGSTTAVLEATTFDGLKIRGEDSVRIVRFGNSLE
jgi:hypothetical protein